MSVLSRAIRSLFVTPERLGRRGENAAAGRLGWVDFLGYQGKIIRNAYIPGNDGKTTEIDLLYVTQKGIFVIESKNYSGFIFGSEKNQHWASTLYMGKDWRGRKKVEKHQFYNPIWQNNTHIRYLKRFLKADIPMFSVIVFSSKCELKRMEISSPDVIVCRQGELSSCIRRIWKRVPDVLTEQQIETIFNQLSVLANPSEAVKQKHIQDIHERVNDVSRCPWCGGSLVLRTAKSGKYAGKQFYGCSNYPRCKYIRNI